MKQSIKYLCKALKFALLVPDLHRVAYTGSDKVPIIETYVNIANAYSYNGQHAEALEYSLEATHVASQVL